MVHTSAGLMTLVGPPPLIQRSSGGGGGRVGLLPDMDPGPESGGRSPLRWPSASDDNDLKPELDGLDGLGGWVVTEECDISLPIALELDELAALASFSLAVALLTGF